MKLERAYRLDLRYAINEKKNSISHQNTLVKLILLLLLECSFDALSWFKDDTDENSVNTSFQDFYNSLRCELANISA